jgi:uncharacterized YccA/Bax inhibitor family protein
MANPILNEKAAAAAAKAGWAAPDPASRNTPIPGTAISDGPVSPWSSGGTMTVGGTATATGVLLVLLLGAAAVGWASATTADPLRPAFPGLALVGILVGFACAITLRFKPTWAKVLAPVYAIGEGYFLGVISRNYEAYQHGIVVQAVGATLAVFGVMLVLYKTQIIKVTDRFRRIVIGATMGLMVFYMLSFVVRLIAGASSVNFLSNGSGLGIIISIVAAGLAAMMLAVDFDLIERGAREGWPKGMEWYAAFGLLATLVWLYLEMLRLISQLNRR